MKLTTREIAVFGMLGALMYVSKVIMEVVPNVHLLSVFVISFTVIYGKKALYPIYIYVFLLGIFNGFAAWWVPHLYLWTILWAVTMLFSKKIIKNAPKKIRTFIYMVICALHGFLYGTLYAPLQALMFGLSFDGMVAWIIAGLPWDFVHGVSNFFCGLLIMPIVLLLQRLEKSTV